MSIAGEKIWWKEPNFIVGIVGLFATIIVGFTTYWLTSGSVSREYQERIKMARSEIHLSISKSISEGVMPSKEKIQYVINSICRQYEIIEKDFETPDTIIEDIIARVLANEFLDAKRREELSSELLAVKKQKLPTNDMIHINSTETGSERDVSSAIAMAIASSILAAMSLMLVAERFKKIFVTVPRESEHTVIKTVKAKLLAREILLAFIILMASVLLTSYLFTWIINAPSIFNLSN